MAPGQDRSGPDALLLDVLAPALPSPLPHRIGIAVSGGGDSLALLHLVWRLLAGRGTELRAVTVDHRLRREAAAEAEHVARFCASIGVRHDTLVWDHDEIAGNLPDQSRRARYGLIAHWAKERGIGHVFLGHTADDQAETLLMELAREAGLDGLSGMRPEWSADGIRWQRPLLPVGRAELRDYLDRQGICWIDDPSNTDESYQRVRARKALASLAPLGIGAEGLARVARNLAAAREELVVAALALATRIARTEAGTVRIGRAGLMAAGEDARRRLVVAALRWTSGADYAPRAEALGRLMAAMAAGRSATLAGCSIRTGADEVSFLRELKAVGGIETGTGDLWDKRWRLTGPHDPGLRIRALGAEGLRSCKDWRATGLSRAALVVSPAIWRGEMLIAAPLAGKVEGWVVEIVTPFPEGVLSH